MESLAGAVGRVVAGFLVDLVVNGLFYAVGWLVMKLVTLGRYQPPPRGVHCWFEFERAEPAWLRGTGRRSGAMAGGDALSRACSRGRSAHRSDTEALPHRIIPTTCPTSQMSGFEPSWIA